MNSSTTRQARGAWAEDEALQFLLRQGLRTVTRNYRCPHGEIDLVLRHGDGLVFAEVRYRGRGAWVDAAESVDSRKQRRLVASAEHFLQRHRQHEERACRFDVVAVTEGQGEVRFDWIQDAFQA